MPSQLDHRHEIRAVPDQRGQKRVPQRVRGELRACILAQAADDIIDGALREPSATAPDEQRLLSVDRELLALDDLFGEDLRVRDRRLHERYTGEAITARELFAWHAQARPRDAKQPGEGVDRQPARRAAV